MQEIRHVKSHVNDESFPILRHAEISLSHNLTPGKFNSTVLIVIVFFVV